MDPFTLEYHTFWLKKLCRVCGLKAQLRSTNKPPKEAVAYTDGIKNTYGIDIEHDKDDQHPSKLCNKC